MKAATFLALLLTLSVSTVLPAAEPRAKAKAPATPKVAAARDWSQLIVRTPEGGVRMGNPNARVHLVEYGSLTCHVCADFSTQGMSPLVANYVKRGRASFEFRPFIRGSYDLAASLLATCAPPQRFFPMIDHLFATQKTWVAKLDTLTPQQRAGFETQPVGAVMQTVAKTSGLDAVAGRFGVAPAQATMCLTDKKRYDQMMAHQRTAITKYKVEGTPTFFVNGLRANASDWEWLEPYLKLPGE